MWIGNSSSIAPTLAPATTGVSALPAGYSVEVDGCDASAWHQVLGRFADANIYQAWAYEQQRSGRGAMSHWVLKRNGAVVAAAQLRMATLGPLPIGAAYVRWGPLWQERGKEADLETLRVAMRALRQEYVERRGLVLRVLPVAFEHQGDAQRQALAEAGFVRNAQEIAQRTLLVDLSAPLDLLRKGLDQKWRNGLNRAEKAGLEVRSGDDDELFGLFLGLYEQMHERKQFHETSDAAQYRLMQAQLPQPCRLHVAIALHQGQPAAGLVCSLMGDTGVYLYGATGELGLRNQASYLLQWQTLMWLKAAGAKRYNLHGINPITNPGTYHFKAGLCGRNGVDTHYLGAYDASSRGVSQAVVALATRLRGMVRRAKANRRSKQASPTHPARAVEP
jgi:lipid II:glycine glycyltransferase (peptidoglycan interpeptide bridge formation enzyme)